MFLQEKIKNINMRLRELEGYAHIVVWGAGTHTSKLFEVTELCSYSVKDIVDTNRQGNYFFGFIVKHPEKINWSDVGAVVISAPYSETEIMQSLVCEMRFTGKIITLYTEGENTPFYSLYSEDLSQICYLDNYNSWDECLRECKGYDDTVIINKVIDATNKVVDGSALWERDGYLFYEQKYVYRICALILKCALQNENRGVRILDVGGALGSTYFQNRNYFKDAKMEYIIAEQEHYAAYGHANLESEGLKFISSSANYEELGKLDIVLLSGSLQYIYQYRETILKIEKLKPHYIVIDRTLVGNKKRICKQLVPETIYKSSYPVWIFTEEEVENFFSSDYKIVEKDLSSVPEEAIFLDGRANSRYYVFENIHMQ